MRRTLPAWVGLLAAFFLASCGGGGGGGSGTSTPPPPANNPPNNNPPAPTLPDPATAPALKTVIAGRFGVVDFPVGAAIEPSSTTGADATLLAKHMSSLTAENAMKPDAIASNGPDALDFSRADQIVAFANANGMRVRGHTLVWHQTAPSWFFAGDRSDPAAYRAAVRQRLHDYIFAVIAHFPDVYAWDVVNEVASDTPNDPNPYRTNSPWYDAYSVGGDGKDYVLDAFLFATQARESLNLTSADMKLMINDYSTESPGKLANVLAIVQDVMNAGTGADINGVGHQFHLQRGADVAQITAALAAVENLSSTLENHVTELDVSIYQDPGSCFSTRTNCAADYGANPPQSALSQQATLYRQLFAAFNRPSVTSITTWGIADNHTWLNSFPVNRTNRPLLFDTNRNPKWAFWAVVDPTIVVP